MKQTLKIIIVSLLLLSFITQCSEMDGPEATAKNNFSEWAVNIRIPYRNESFQTIKNNGTDATVLVTVDLKIKGEWIEKHIQIDCEKLDKDWQCDRSMQYD